MKTPFFVTYFFKRLQFLFAYAILKLEAFYKRLGVAFSLSNATIRGILQMKKVQPHLYTEMSDYTPEDHYVFVSYSHKDSDVVYADLEKLYELGVKFWYDKGLEAGSDLWFTQIEKRVRDPRCVAVIFYLSPYVFVSESIEK